MSAQCRLCAAPLRQVFADFGAVPLANSYVRPEQADQAEHVYRLRALVCGSCFLVQLDTLVDPAAIFGEYAYFSSYSDTLLAASNAYVRMIVERLRLQPGDRVVEIASNDGYLLQHFKGTGVDALGIEPAANVAQAAIARGVPTLNRFFGAEAARELAGQGRRARLIVANNVLAHVPDLHDFVSGLKVLLEPGGLITIEFHHLLNLVQQCQFDAIYHEHFQYYSLASARQLLAAHGLKVVDVEEIPSQGGSLRVYARHDDDPSEAEHRRVADILESEARAGLRTLASYLEFSNRVAKAKLALLAFLGGARESGKSVVCYGAAAKGTMLLNSCGIRADLVDYAVDRSPHKQGLLMPGSRIPIRRPANVMETRPDYLLILPWNLRSEIMSQMSPIRSWGGRFVVPLPELQILS